MKITLQKSAWIVTMQQQNTLPIWHLPLCPPSVTRQLVSLRRACLQLTCVLEGPLWTPDLQPGNAGENMTPPSSFPFAFIGISGFPVGLAMCSLLALKRPSESSPWLCFYKHMKLWFCSFDLHRMCFPDLGRADSPHWLCWGPSNVVHPSFTFCVIVCLLNSPEHLFHSRIPPFESNSLLPPSLPDFHPSDLGYLVQLFSKSLAILLSSPSASEKQWST